MIVKDEQHGMVRGTNDVPNHMLKENRKGLSIEPYVTSATACPPVVKCSLGLILGEISISGIALPVALSAHTTVKSSLRSADVKEPTWLFPFSVTICFGACTIVAPVPSRLFIIFGWKNGNCARKTKYVTKYIKCIIK